MSARLEDGWVRVTYDGSDLAVVDIGLGEATPLAWQPAFMHTLSDGERVVQVRPQTLDLLPNPKVWVRVNGVATLIGRIGEVPVQTGRRRRG